MVNLHANAIQSRIARWREAGLIDGATADRLLAFEAGEAAPAGRTFTIIGALSIALGVIAVISANWDAFPIWFKLSGHVVANLALGFWAAACAKSDAAGWRTDAPLIILSASTIAFIAHVGQAFQLQGDPLSPLLAWLALTTPFTVALGRGAAIRWIWTIGFGATTGVAFEMHFDRLADAHLLSAAVAAMIVIAFAAPLVLRGARLGAWGTHCHHLALAALVAFTTLAQFAWRWTAAADPLADIRQEALISAPLAVAGLALAATLMGAPPWRRLSTLFIVLSPVYAALPLVTGGAESEALEAAATCLYWLAIALLSHSTGWMWIYKLAVVVVALRLFAVFIESFAGLLMTGGGLIVAGLLLLALGHAVRRFLQKTAQPTAQP